MADGLSNSAVFSHGRNSRTNGIGSPGSKGLHAPKSLRGKFRLGGKIRVSERRLPGSIWMVCIHRKIRYSRRTPKPRRERLGFGYVCARSFVHCLSNPIRPELYPQHRPGNQSLWPRPTGTIATEHSVRRQYAVRRHQWFFSCRREYNGTDRCTYRRQLQCRIPNRTQVHIVSRRPSAGAFPRSKRESPADDGKRPAVRAANAGGGGELAKDADGSRSAHFTRWMDLASRSGARHVSACTALAAHTQ